MSSPAATTSSTVGVVAALVVGLLCGLVNGAVIVYGPVNPVIATLAVAVRVSDVSVTDRVMVSGPV